MEGDDNVSHHHHPAMVTTNPQPEANHPNAARTAGEGGGGAPPAPGKVENGVNPATPHAGDRWDGSGAGLNNKVETQAPPPLSVLNQQATEAPPGGGVSVKVATTVLQPICLGDSPVVHLPIHLQMSGAAGAPPLGQMGATPYFMTSQGPLSLPLVLDQQLLQHLSSQAVIPQMASGCPALPLQNNVLCQNASLTFGLPPHPPPPHPALDQKSSGGASSPDSNLLSLLQNPAFAAILQDLFTSQAAASSACQSPGSAPIATDPFTSAFFTSQPPPPPPPPPLHSHPYLTSSPPSLAPLVPPATLLVPYPVVIPLPVPLPIPLPIPVPVPQAVPEDSKGNVMTPPRPPVCTVSRSTQTSTSSSSSSSHPSFSARFAAAPPQPPHVAPPPSSCSLPSPSDGEVLDLSVSRVVPPVVQPKQEFPSPQQDNVLDLSVAGAKKKYIQPQCAPAASSLGGGAGGDGREFNACQSGGPEPPPCGSSSALSLGVLRPMDGPALDSKQLLSGLATLEFSRHQHKWLVDSGGAGGLLGREAGGASLGGGPEMVSAAQTTTAHKVIVSVKDAIPAILCGKIKGLSGVSTKNFSIKRDGGGGTGQTADAVALQQLYGGPPPSSSSVGGPPGGEQQQHDPSDPLGRKAPKNRAIKVKKVSSQEIHFLPIKKQRLAAFLPRK